MEKHVEHRKMRLIESHLRTQVPKIGCIRT